MLSSARRATITVILSLATCHAALAGEGSGSVRITQVYVHASGSHMALSVDSPHYVNPGQCEDTDMYLLERDVVGQPAFDIMVRQATAALLAHARVEIWLEGCTRGKYWGNTRPRIRDFRVNAS